MLKRSMLIALAFLLGTSAVAYGFPLLAFEAPPVYYAAPDKPVESVQNAVGAIKSGNVKLSDGNPAAADADFVRAQRYLVLAGRSAATYMNHAESPTNFDAVIEMEIALGRYFYERRRSIAFSAYRNAVKTYDLAFPVRDSRERDWLRLAAAGKYQASFKVFEAWRRSAGMGPQVPEGTAGAYYAGLRFAAEGQWDAAVERLQFTVSQTKELNDAHTIIGLIYHLQHRPGATFELLEGARFPGTSTSPSYSSLTIDSLRFAIYYE